MAKSSQIAIKKLFSATDNEQCIKAINKLGQLAASGDREAVQALAQYMNSGAVIGSRWFAAAELSDLVPYDGIDCSQVFLGGLVNSETRYSSIIGLIKSLGAAAYPHLVALALDPNIPREERARAIVELSSYSSQPFDRGTDRNLSKWRDIDFRIDEIENWRDSGFPSGMGCEQPLRDPGLDSPKTSLEQAAASFDSLLSVARAKDRRNRTNPANYLSPANQKDLLAISRKWVLPQKYLEFLTRFSPNNIICQLKLPGYGPSFSFYSASELIDAQVGYAVQPTQEPIECWPEDYLCIGDAFADPFVLDLSNIVEGDSPVLTAKHGQGIWDFRKYSRSFEAFLGRITVIP